jgi:octaheme c-type cytochrome (tetrathionate reductase family)
MPSDRSAFVRNSDLGVSMLFKQIVAFAVVSLLLGPTVMAAESASGSAAKVLASTADHRAFKALQQEFNSGPEVTKVCLSCHTNAAKQIHQTQHWKWEWVNPKTNQVLGKRHVINDFCTSTTSNMEHCAECHIGYNHKEDKYDFASETNVDCLICHDTTGKYHKAPEQGGNVFAKDTEFPPGSGKVLKGLDLKLIAQSVGPTSRHTCGQCHFNGGGGDAVKHGDLDSGLETPSKALDVHMDAKGNNFTCSTCHVTQAHQVSGSRYAPTAMDKAPAFIRGETAPRAATCQSCHGQKPHRVAKLNDHTDKLACQTCHVPAFARGDLPTKMSWDWSTTGKKDAKGQPAVEKNDDGFVTYAGNKGTFTYADNVKPEYIWFNGTVKYTLFGDKVEDNGKPVESITSRAARPTASR